MKRSQWLGAAWSLSLFCAMELRAGETALGEIEARAAGVTGRVCVAGANAGSACNQNTDCPGSTCVDRNLFNITVAVHFNASNAQLLSIRTAIEQGSERLFDATDGQAQIGSVELLNNAYGISDADLRVYPSSLSTGWYANTGNWQVGGSIHVSIDTVEARPQSFAHEFVHLVFDARDEYESRPGCTSDSALLVDDTCPIQATIDAGQAACIMHGSSSTELCWGQGDASDPTDIGAGNHDADNTTEQSQCRSNRSCWDQIVWSWPNTFLAPEGAPDPAANGLVAAPPTFVVLNNTGRGVLVLDESGSMSLDAPSRIERLKTGANDFIALAENGTELGLVSFATDAQSASGRSRIGIAPLAADRSALISEVDSLGPATRTNIGAGLQAARDLIDDAGGVTGNTFIVLMTDGLNNEPGSEADAEVDLQSKIEELRDASIEVYVTCTGGDVGLESQCSEIADGTRGVYVDSASAADLPESFADIGAITSGHELIAAQGTRRSAMRARPARAFKSKTALRLAEQLFKAIPVQDTNKHLFYVEKESESALFVLQWKNARESLKAVVVSPSGRTYDMSSMPLGLFRRVSKPEEGDWMMHILSGKNSESDYVAKAFSRNRGINVPGGVRYPAVRPGEEMTVFAYPRSFGRALSARSEPVPMLVTRPDGSYDLVLLHDRGRDKLGRGDDVAGDGVFTGVYRDTQMKGAYQFASLWSVDGWPEAPDAKPHHHGDDTKEHVHEDDHFRSPRFQRELRLSVAVADPRDIDRKPDDPPAKPSPRQ